METVQVKVTKGPKYGTFFNIRDTFVNKALKEKKKLEIIWKNERIVVDPEEWVKTGKVEYQEFLIPGKPMKLYGNHLNRFKEDDLQATLF